MAHDPKSYILLQSIEAKYFDKTGCKVIGIKFERSSLNFFLYTRTVVLGFRTAGKPPRVHEADIILHPKINSTIRTFYQDNDADLVKWAG